MNPRSPFVLDIRQLRRQPGSRNDYRRDVFAPAQLNLEMIGVPENATLALTVRLESVTEGVLATGSVSGPLIGECGRCLVGFTDEFDEEFTELFAYPDSTTEQKSDFQEVALLDGDRLDLEPVVRDAIVLSLPLTPLCDPDCGGLCVDCGGRIDDLPPDHTHEVIDARWAALAARVDSAPQHNNIHTPNARTSNNESQE